ncbi:MAG TPA: TauD/TfdA family dioxygenase [Microlunatus sp.]|nr:TauD/TfdA family dioxygenase [Microlunatus sp.]
MFSSAPVSTPQHLRRRSLSARTATILDRVARDLAARLGTITAPGLAAAVDARMAELPAEVAEAVRPPGDDGAVIIDGLGVDDAELGPTPTGWQEAEAAGIGFAMILLLLARSAGQPFGWRNQQRGRIVNTIVPAPGQEHTQTGAGSTVPLAPHTEDAFHPRRAGLIMLGCLRNPDRVGTTVASVRRIRLDHDQRRLLAEPTLPILPDDSYGTAPDPEHEVPVPALWEGPDGPTLRFDPAYTPLDRAESHYRAAYDELTAELDRVSVAAALAPGELLVIDNDVAVHGRVPFTARYDGTDRWLQRVNVRLPDRPRRPAEAAETGYGEQVVEPFGGR